MATSSAPSPALIRAVVSENDRIERSAAALVRKRTVLLEDLAALDQALADLEQRRKLLAVLVGDQPSPQHLTDIDAGSSKPSRLLKGRELRRVAGRLLWEQVGAAEVHYRDWMDRVLTAGYVVGGKDAAASFLTNIRDSPAVARGTRAGFYRVDPSSRQRVEQRVLELQAELDDLAHVLGASRSAEHTEELRLHRDQLTRQLRRAQGDIEEISEVFNGTPGADHTRLRAI